MTIDSEQLKSEIIKGGDWLFWEIHVSETPEHFQRWCIESGHDFSRAVRMAQERGFNP
jgi:hypothetical protein